MSKTLKNYYKVLEIANFADEADIKASYKKLARQYHPDVNPNDKTVEEKFKLINEAYETLKDAQKRRFYDQSLRITMNMHQSSQKKSSGSSTKKPGDTKNTGNQKPKKESTVKDNQGNTTSINDLFDSFFKKSFGNQSTAEKKPEPKKESFTGQSKPSSQNSQQKSSEQKTGDKTPRRGQDVTVETEIAQNEAAEGTVKTVNVQHNEICNHCSGTGKVSGSVCNTCDGKKYSTRHKKIDVRIPAGVKNGSKVRVASEGGRGHNGGKEGDLFLKIKITMDNNLRIEGMDVFGDVEIDVLDAILGTSTEVNTMNGRIKMTIPELTPSGKVFRLKEQGIQSGKSKGDHFVTVKITMPDTLSAEEKELYKKLNKLRDN